VTGAGEAIGCTEATGAGATSAAGEAGCGEEAGAGATGLRGSGRRRGGHRGREDGRRRRGWWRRAASTWKQGWKQGLTPVQLSEDTQLLGCHPRHQKAVFLAPVSGTGLFRDVPVTKQQWTW
jgi:hypothetical protein